jgi:hypothetical protein
VLGDAMHVTSIRKFVNLLEGKFGSEARAESYTAAVSRLCRENMAFKQLHL